MAQEQQIVHFFGRVQGVGFRWTACRVAADCEVTGYVRNLPDGSVECLIEGDSAEIEAFLGRLCDQMGGYISKHSKQKAPYSGQFEDFGVRF